MTELLDKTVGIVKQAAQLMLADGIEIRQKESVVNIVTSADVNVQTFLERHLPQLLPGSVVFGEEGIPNGKNARYLWIVDPIDGTMNYARGVGESAVSVGLLENGEPKLGVVFNPFKNELFRAEAGKGAWLGDRQLRVSDASFAQGLFCTAWSLYNKAYAPQCMAVMRDAYGECNDFRRFGSCALELCYLAAGRCDLFFEMRVFPWDWAAGGLILREAGGVISGLDGKLPPFDRTTPIIAANHRDNHEKLRRVVTKHIPQVPYEEILL